MSNHAIVISQLDEQQVATVMHYTKRMGFHAAEVLQNDTGEYNSISEVANYYRQGYPQHQYVEEALGRGYSIVEWDDLSHDEKTQFAEFVELYSDMMNDSLSPDLNQAWDDFESFTSDHQQWLLAPSDN